MASSPTRPSSPDILTGRPKYHTRGPPSPPPAYAPRPGGPIFMNPYLAARLAQQAAFAPSSLPRAAYGLPPPPPHRRPYLHPHPTTAAHGWHNIINNNNNNNNNDDDDDDLSDADDDDADDDDDDAGERSPAAITVRIATAMRVAGDHNLVCLPGGGGAHPAETARFVAQAVTRVLRGGGADARGGIPMIDEEGRPRPLRIEIEAGTEVRGEGNVLGSERVVMRALLGKRRREEREEEEEEGEEGKNDVQVLRRRRVRCASV